jgi:hypothetical protein
MWKNLKKMKTGISKITKSKKKKYLVEIEEKGDLETVIEEYKLEGKRIIQQRKKK